MTVEWFDLIPEDGGLSERMNASQCGKVLAEVRE
ncbi:protein of unknown function (plasmid) [Caballeronia sp. S22]|jgi:hypothetical protein